MKMKPTLPKARQNLGSALYCMRERNTFDMGEQSLILWKVRDKAFDSSSDLLHKYQRVPRRGTQGARRAQRRTIAVTKGVS